MKINIILTNDDGEQFLGEVELTKSSRKQSKKIVHVENKKQDKTKPIYSIEKLYRAGFFKDAKKLGDVYSRLKKDGFNFKKGSIQYALDSAKFLDRQGTKGNYKWIQKFPSG